jgi:NAD(P)-dependent dehydrogenase (short-subunit alcohol dehydrogenase family)
MQDTLRGKNALVTGGSRGIGRAIAIALAAQGAKVALGYVRNATRAEEVVKTITAGQGKAVAIKADLSQPGEVTRLFDGAEANLGAWRSSSPMPPTSSSNPSPTAARKTMTGSSTPTPRGCSSH